MLTSRRRESDARIACMPPKPRSPTIGAARSQSRRRTRAKFTRLMLGVHLLHRLRRLGAAVNARCPNGGISACGELHKRTRR
jgi:hypothetical protein